MTHVEPVGHLLNIHTSESNVVRRHPVPQYIGLGRSRRGFIHSRWISIWIWPTSQSTACIQEQVWAVQWRWPARRPTLYLLTNISLFSVPSLLFLPPIVCFCFLTQWPTFPPTSSSNPYFHPSARHSPSLCLEGVTPVKLQPFTRPRASRSLLPQTFCSLSKTMFLSWKSFLNISSDPIRSTLAITRVFSSCWFLYKINGWIHTSHSHIVSSRWEMIWFFL